MQKTHFIFFFFLVSLYLYAQNPVWANCVNEEGGASLAVGSYNEESESVHSIKNGDKPKCGEQLTYAGKIYNTIQVGTQCWMKENLNVGKMIQGKTRLGDNEIIEKFCYDNQTANCDTYGGLYNWDEAMAYSTIAGSAGICPDGWHIPTEEEFDTLHSSVGYDGNSLKAVGQGILGHKYDGGRGTNTSGFSALLAGNFQGGKFNDLGVETRYWSSTQSDYFSENALHLYLYNDGSSINVLTSNMDQGLSVRCILSHSIDSISDTQDIVIDTVVFKGEYDSTDRSNIPYLIDRTGNNKIVVEKINEVIKKEFDIESFDAKKENRFSWYGVEFSTAIKSNVLLISYSGEYRGAHSNYISVNLFFDLMNGELVKEMTLPFNALFSLDGYFSFLNKHWLTGCNREINNSVKSARLEYPDFQPFCDSYDIDITFQNNKITFDLTRECFAYGFRNLSPGYSITLDSKQLEPFLSDFGKWLINESGYCEMSILDKFLFLSANSDKIPNYIFIVGSLEGKYPFSMALDLNEKTKEVIGYYSFDNQEKKTDLHGRFDPIRITLTVKQYMKSYAWFNFVWDKLYKEKYGFYGANAEHWSGKWINDSNEQKKVVIKDVKKNK